MPGGLAGDESVISTPVGERFRGSDASRAGERGMALMITLMIMMLLSALMIGFMTSIMADQRSSGVDRDQTQAYAVAHAGMEKLTSDLAALFTDATIRRAAPQINALTAYPPSVTGLQLHRSRRHVRLQGPVHGADGSGRELRSRRRHRSRPTIDRHDDRRGSVPGVQGAGHALQHHGHGAVERRLRGPDAARAADRRRAGVPVRPVLGEQPGVPLRATTSTSAAASTPTATCSCGRRHPAAR